jgi:hypothetical protein
MPNNNENPRIRPPIVFFRLFNLISDLLRKWMPQ